MCGINIAISKDVDKNEKFFKNEMQILSHRGQDSFGFFEDKNIKIAHRRLAITGSDGIQPIDSNGVVVAVNGEFYDYEKTKKEHNDYCFITDSDSEIIIPLFIKKGIIETAKMLNGEFVFSLYEKKTENLYLVRDMFGNKPLYYMLTESGIFISSEIKSFLSLGKLEFDEEVLVQKLQMQYHHPSKTLFKNIFQVEPGQIVEIKTCSKEINKYFFENLYQESRNDFSLETVKNKLNKAVEMRIKNQKPAITLSGGLDSSIILSIIKDQNPNFNNVFSVSFKDSGLYDEKPLVQILEKHFDLDVNYLDLSIQDMIKVFEEAIFQAEDVAVNIHVSAKYLLFKEISKKGNKVVLSGEGSDEFFFGYTHFYQNPKTYLQGMHIPHGEILETKESLPVFLKAKLSIGKKIEQFLNIKKPVSFVVHDEISAKLTPEEQASYLWSKYALSNSILLALGDKQEMKWTLEGRTPFLDKELVKYLMSLKCEDKIDQNMDKFILRTIFKDILPKEIIEKGKHPFIAPPLLDYPEGVNFYIETLKNWNNNIFNKKVAIDFLQEVEKLSDQEKRAYDSAFMIMTSLAILEKRYCGNY